MTAIRRLLKPQPLEQRRSRPGRLGRRVTRQPRASPSLLLRVARRRHSITLEANAQHLLTDVWTSAGVLIGVGAVVLTGWQRLDPLVALVVAANIVWTGVRIVRRSTLGLMDTALPGPSSSTIRRVLDGYGRDGIEYHALRTRQAGARQFRLGARARPGRLDRRARPSSSSSSIEAAIRGELPHATVLTHLEPVGDPASFLDLTLDR